MEAASIPAGPPASQRIRALLGTYGLIIVLLILPVVFATKDRSSVLGTYSIDENGDTTLTDYGAYGVENGELKFDQTIKAQAG